MKWKDARDEFFNSLYSRFQAQASAPILENAKGGSRCEKGDQSLLGELEELRRQQNEILQIVEESQEMMYNVLRISKINDANG